MANIDVKQKAPGSEITRSGRGENFPFSLASGGLFSNPFSLMHRMTEEMDRTFGRFFSQGAGGGNLSTWYPAVEVAERDGKLQVHAELPGLKPEDVKVEVTDDALIIQGERKSEHEENQGGVYRSERRYGQFYREIPLPMGAKAEEAKAQFNNGVLEVTLPVPEQTTNRRQIPIESKT
jgi:Molecular chaperone (small heat shock protein)